eukprot:8649431-Pyramimonas_sp.AAC.1
MRASGEGGAGGAGDAERQCLPTVGSGAAPDAYTCSVTLVAAGDFQGFIVTNLDQSIQRIAYYTSYILRVSFPPKVFANLANYTPTRRTNVHKTHTISYEQAPYSLIGVGVGESGLGARGYAPSCSSSSVLTGGGQRALHDIPSLCGSSCANNGEGALNTPEALLREYYTYRLLDAYNRSVDPFKRGDYLQVTVRHEGLVLGSGAPLRVTVSPAAVAAGNTTVAGGGLFAAGVNEPASFTVVPRDVYGN